jgi:hypothetical protein
VADALGVEATLEERLADRHGALVLTQHERDDMRRARFGGRVDDAIEPVASEAFQAAGGHVLRNEAIPQETLDLLTNRELESVAVSRILWGKSFSPREAEGRELLFETSKQNMNTAVVLLRSLEIAETSGAAATANTVVGLAFWTASTYITAQSGVTTEISKLGFDMAQSARYGFMDVAGRPFRVSR